MIQRWQIPPQFYPWTPIIGIFRCMLALSTLSTLVLTPRESLFQPLAGMNTGIVCDAYTQLGLYCVLGEQRSELSVWTSIAVLLLVCTGIFPQVTSILHWYVVWSFSVACTIPDGGDQIAVFIAFALMLICLVDNRWNHWIRPSEEGPSPRRLRQAIAFTGLLIIKLQMSFLYLNSSTGKMAQEEWANGTHMYYVSFGYFAPDGWRGSLFDLIVTHSISNFILAWGVICLEFTLGLMLLLSPRERIPLFIMGVCLHVGIAFFLAISSFQLAMLVGLAMLALPSANRFYRLPSSVPEHAVAQPALERG